MAVSDANSSPDLTPREFFPWGYLKDIIFKEPCTAIMQLQNRIQEVCAVINNPLAPGFFYNENRNFL